MGWKFMGLEFTDPTGYYGFVYKITHIPTGRQYIGRKYFTLSATKRIKGKKKRIRKESDWKDYWGSSKHLKSDIEKFGKKEFKREILRLCKNRTECSYYETKYIFDNDALLREDFYNHWVSCKITETHVKSMKK